MPRMTLHDQYVLALQAEGYEIVPDARSGRYTVMTRTRQPEMFYYIGSNGALRYGPTVASSIPCGDKRKARLVENLVRGLQKEVGNDA